MLRTFADGRLFGSVTGPEPPRVLALHGWARTHRDFDAVVAPEGGSPLPCLALDLPGFGASPPPADAWGAADYARAVGVILDEMEGPVVVLGHSFGGKVAVHLASQRPESIRALVLTGVPLLPASGRRARLAPTFRLTRRLHLMRLIAESTMEAARQRHGSADYRAAEGVMRPVLVRSVSETYEEELGAARCPVHLVWGADDTAAPLEMAERAVALVAEGDLVSFPGVGHLTPLLIPAALHTAVVSCLA
jgi:pimeloyl-ACP methyl ester carboxylesterase